MSSEPSSQISDIFINKPAMIILAAGQQLGVRASFDEWPGGQDVADADEHDAFEENMSGLYYELSSDVVGNSSGAAEDVLWSVSLQNKPGMQWVQV